MGAAEDRLPSSTIELLTVGQDGDLVYGFNDRLCDVLGSRLTAFAFEPANNWIPLIEILAHRIGRQFKNAKPSLGGANVILRLT